MKRQLFLLLTILISCPAFSQELYFPPTFGNAWATTNPEELGLCTENIDPLYDYLEENDTKAFIVLKDGKIVLEKYFGTFTLDSTWYWASAGKSLTAFMVGLAQEDGYLSIHDPSSTYLGTGWTNCTPEQEEKITVRHQLTMTTGLDDRIDDTDCTLPECLDFLTDPGTRWAYHNAPYTLLDQVIEGATGKNLNGYINEKLTFTTGMTGAYFSLGYNNVFFSKPRSMARFGLVILNQGNWNGNQIMEDTSYLNAMISPSQDLNESYGYLWWLNGKESFMLPGSQFVFDGPAVPQAPADMVSALGKNGQILNVVPSENLVMVRMGNAPPDFVGAVSVELNRQIWDRFNQIRCTTTTIEVKSIAQFTIYPNPAGDCITIDFPTDSTFDVELYSFGGQLFTSRSNCFQAIEIPLNDAQPGLYYVRVISDEGSVFYRGLVIE